LENLDEWCAGMEARLRTRIARMPFAVFQNAFTQGGYGVFREVLGERYGSLTSSVLDTVDTLLGSATHPRGCPYLGWGQAALPPRDTLALLYELIVVQEGRGVPQESSGVLEIDVGDLGLL